MREYVLEILNEYNLFETFKNDLYENGEEIAMCNTNVEKFNKCRFKFYLAYCMFNIDAKNTTYSKKQIDVYKGYINNIYNSLSNININHISEYNIQKINKAFLHENDNRVGLWVCHELDIISEVFGIQEAYNYLEYAMDRFKNNGISLGQICYEFASSHEIIR